MIILRTIAVVGAAALAMPTTAIVNTGSSVLPRPLRGWAFPFNMTTPFRLYARGTVNFLSTFSRSPPYSQNATDLAAHGVTVVQWAQCWNDPYFKKRNESCVGHNCTLANATAVVAKMALEASVDRSLTANAPVVGRGLDECNLDNAQFADERELAAEGFRRARREQPDTIIAGWGAIEGDTLFASLMRDGTFDLAMIEGYTYCPGCSDWPAPGNGCCPVPSTISHWQSYQGRIEYAKAQGYLNRTVFCFGFLLGKSKLNPYGWTKATLREAVATLKAAYPELAGVLMYGHDPRKGYPNATSKGTPETDEATFDIIREANALMLEFYPDDTDD